MRNITTYFKRITTYTLVSMIVLTPAFAFAKENDKKGEENKRSNIFTQVKKTTPPGRQISQFAQSVKRTNSSPVILNKHSENNKKEKDDDRNEGKGNLQSCFVKLSKLTIADILKLNLPTSTTLANICTKLATTTPVTTTPDVTAPLINSITPTIGTSSVSVVISTNEPSNIKVFYGTSTVNTSSTYVQSSGYSTSTTVNISGLTSSTSYNLVIQATDSSNNVTLSGSVPVTTNAPSADTAAPIITGLGTITSSSINVQWSTNELATTKVYYGTTTPVSTSTATFLQNVTLVTSHAILIPGLVANTIYHLIVESKDAAGNLVNSIEFPITTPAN